MEKLLLMEKDDLIDCMDKLGYIEEERFEDNIFKKAVIQSAEIELSNIIDEWCKSNSNGCSGGEMREKRGSDIETFVRTTINKIGKILNIDLHARCGNDDKKDLIINLPDGKKLIKQHQVDVHIYLNGVFVAVIECKAYLDSC